MSNDKLAATGYEPAKECPDPERDWHEQPAKVGVTQDPAVGVRQMWLPQPRPGQAIDDLSMGEWVGQALGAASACWSNLAEAGVFDSTQCAGISQALESHINGVVRALIEEGERRRQITARYLQTQYNANLEAAEAAAREEGARQGLGSYDEGTLMKVRAGLRTVLGSEQVITDAIAGMQNEGILFRERT